MSELSSDARALIDAGRFGDEPAGHDKARVRERLVRQLGVGAFAGTGMLAVVRSGGDGGQTGALRPSPASSTDAVTLPRGVTPAPKLAGAAAGRVGSALWVKSIGGVVAAATAAGALYSGAALLERPSDVPPPIPAAPAQIEPALEPTPTIEPLVVTQQAEPAPATKEEPSAHASGRRARREEAPSVKDSLAAELGLLARAQRMLRDREPERALVVVREHAERFPEGSLQEERAGIEALARCMLGDTDAPSVRAFLERSPSSPLAARVRKECKR